MGELRSYAPFKNPQDRNMRNYIKSYFKFSFASVTLCSNIEYSAIIL